ncbi:hypothetical protein GCM10011487_04040 [Steroidobacter agaridevorans]|uniref:DUF5916 domain-containing protein n=1 Tax=Steroidobacter agaridevorans TaxID=2695856 RepID=A0A829Y5C8_9GAMM|nr:DUF5916 domain-containing protein [Steroidobacter agaridevorans]GFE78404.1 hypothetical protein GCM10011487_04040 [Steroidobacter agaridevorans]GFE89664.1 hypothetical protein GCM10011488_46180 [Steroidobacter agaridevorans]
MRTAPVLNGAAPRTPLATILCALLLLAFVTICCTTAHAELVIDGRIDEPEWQGATVCKDWQRTLPFARDQPRYGNELHILSTEGGLAAAFVIDQPPSERRIKPRTPRDSERLIGDTVSLMVDFDANAQIGYEFTVGLGGGIRDGLITNQNKFDRDWDGAWQHAVHETGQQWFVEIFIPWSSISMRGSGADTRTIGVYGTRYLFERGERYACPGITSEAAVFLSDFQRIEISQHASVASLDVVPYGTLISDFVDDHTRFKAGADINWKASPNLWLSATLNPDFGQVESDELVVDFSAIEVVFTDKRPFFTENQGIFDLRTPTNGQLVYTRRIGAAADDGSAASSDIDAALKLTGTAGQLVYGGFVAQEHDYRNGAGRLFAATRLALPMDHARIGYLGTWADRPFLDRDALVNAVDYELTPSEDWRISGQVIRSDIGTSGMNLMDLALARGTEPARFEENTHGYESWLQADFNRSSPLTHTMKLLYIDDSFDLNDLGYMERNALKQVEWETNLRVASDGGRVSGETQRLYTFYRENTDGQRLQSRFLLSRDVSYASAWKAFQEVRYVTSGVDDLISRGNGPVRLDERVSAYMDITTPRYGDWQFTLGGYLFQQGVEDYSGWLQFLAAWYPTEKLTLRVDLLPQYSADWLVWEDSNLFGSYRAKRFDYDFRLDWIPAPRHELRVKWQWIGIDADLRSAYRTDAAGNLLPSSDPVAPFTVNNLGLQIRYRYEIGPMSELFLVYARGGYNFIDEDERGVSQLFRDMTDVRDADQFLIKLRYKL